MQRSLAEAVEAPAAIRPWGEQSWRTESTQLQNWKCRWRNRTLGGQEVQTIEQVDWKMAVQAGHVQQCWQIQAEAPGTVRNAWPVDGQVTGWCGSSPRAIAASLIFRNNLPPTCVCLCISVCVCVQCVCAWCACVYLCVWCVSVYVCVHMVCVYDVCLWYVRCVYVYGCVCVWLCLSCPVSHSFSCRTSDSTQGLANARQVLYQRTIFSSCFSLIKKIKFLCQNLICASITLFLSQALLKLFPYLMIPY